jgi:hypothetical protein
MSAAVDGTIIAIGASGQTYMRGCYFPDAAGGVIRFDNGAGASATSSDFATWNETVSIQDIVLGTATTPAALQFRLTLNGTPTSQLFRVALQLTSVAFRPRLNLTIPAGARLGGIMVT